MTPFVIKKINYLSVLIGGGSGLVLRSSLDWKEGDRTKSKAKWVAGEGPSA